MASQNATRGFRFTHTGLRVTDIDRSVEFYSGVFGMKELGRMLLDTVTIVFMGYSDSVASEAPLFGREGVLELNADKISSTLPNNHDSRIIKLAFGVPDMESAMEHIRKQGVRILKETGDSRGFEVISTFLGCETPDKGFDKSLWEAAVPVPFIEDPDGYLIEIIPYSV
ncbi:Glyoxalase/Bleomycin resistance protein/Dihydroxybiphenyl dioxygenase [Fusarium redolens]|uniref:Glyoxalase/Bleomycin resistance protein/Dihydroxybiphenyl dioxygenase n=1 Tax=Fusarium redolens TaxID=48865 RepID=A0A9P9FYQ0_FUSRE|nr:Glyoxalase/Bleomycin resistance protein/Dihydroxybiphenyl dioxygenase [Fusarium redolens]KAH7207851.1 Glyoxalase/Bleomycin resistance protein/Dihydroxybiphenyl dioxygenase [Fusarium redolens]